MPTFGAIMIAGYLILFAMELLSENGQTNYSLLLTALGTLIAVLLALPTKRMLEQDDVVRPMMHYAIGFGVFFLLLSIAWQGFPAISIIGIWLPLVMLFSLLESRRQALTLAAIAALFTLLVLLGNAFPPLEAASIVDPGALPAVLLTLFVVAAFVGIGVVTNVVSFRTLAGRLTVTFVAVTILPAMTIVMVLSFQIYRHDQERIFAIMDAIVAQRVSQLEQDITLIDHEMDEVLADRGAQRFLGNLLTSKEGSPALVDAQRDAQNYFAQVIAAGRPYDQVLVLDLNGEVVYSTNPFNRHASFEDEAFYKQALLSAYTTTVSDVPRLGETAFVSARPLDASGKTLGELVFVSKLSSFGRIEESTSDVLQAGEAYLVGEDFRPLTETLSVADAVETQASMDALKNLQRGHGTYENYAGETVLGSYVWVPALRAALISEQPALQSLLPTALLIGNIMLIGLFAIALSTVAVRFTSRSITEPIQDLAGAAGRLSGGDLAARADANRPDELGALAVSFNQMAARLEEIVGNLEARDEERVQDLQRQALRIRAAAEISRDAASALSMGEVLARSAGLITERFGYYHVGIYILDNNREYLVLSAASGEAGRLMVETGYRVRGGESIVASVAQSGASRLIVDLGREPAGTRHPLLPGSRSELGVPLKSYNVLIGVLDVQSDQAHAFAEEDTAVFQLIADQLSIAVEHARILQQSKNNLRELERSYGRFTRESWQSLLRARQGGMIGYTYDGTEFRALAEFPPGIRAALEKGEPALVAQVSGSAKGSNLAVPITVRGTTIGALSLRLAAAAIPAETAQLARDLSERLAQSLEASWLVNVSRVRAEREHLIAEMSQKIGAAADVEQILMTTVEELGRAIGGAPMTITLGTANGGQAQGEA
jgi:putative methionine-R-sulfoxide reductase with GAF domain/HAMP domain-containing protein